MRRFFSIFLLSVFLVFIGCIRADTNNSRAYAEGKISGENVNFSSVTIKLVSDNTHIASAIPDDSGNFVLSGPMTSSSFSLVLNQKIKSFSASMQGCEISGNGKKITVPKEITYIVFHEIVLE